MGLSIYGCAKKSEFSWKMVLDLKNEKLAPVLQKPNQYALQIIYTEVDKASEKIHLKRHQYRLDTTEYFYPASTVKMPVAFLALEKLNLLKDSISGAGIHTPIHFDSVRPPQSPMKYDSCSPSRNPTIASLIDQVFAISDNNAYNRLFEWTGQEFINKSLYQKNIFTNSRILTRVGVSGFDSIENTHLNPITFLNEEGDTIYHQTAQQSVFTEYPTIRNYEKGKGYYDASSAKIIEQPFDMSQKNFINLADLDRIIKRIVYPTLYEKEKSFKIAESDYQYLLESMAKLPEDFLCYADNKDHYYDSYVKFFLFGDHKNPIPEHITIINKVGLAYGYLTDVAYIRDHKNDVEFFLSATLLVNNNEIFNDGVYEYDSVGIPFLAELGRKIYAYELSKKQMKLK